MPCAEVGADHHFTIQRVCTWAGTPGGVHPANALLLVIAMAKVCFVGAYFMDLREAPLALCVVFEVWTWGAAVALSALYLIA